MSAWWSGFRRSARIPPWTFGCSVTTRWPRMAGKPVSSATSVTARLASRRAAAVPPLETRSHPMLRQLPGQLDHPGLVVHGQQRPHQLLLLLEDRRIGEHGSDRRRVEVALHGLDALVERGLVVVGQDRHGLLGEDRPGVHLEGGHVDRAARDLDAGLEGVADRVPALEGRQEGRVGVQDAVGEAVVDRLGEHRPEAGHDDEVDPGLLEDVGDLRGVLGPVEVLAEAGPLDQLGRHAVGLGHLGGPGGPVDEDQLHGDAVVEDGLQQGPAARGEDGDAHRGKVPVGRRRPDPTIEAPARAQE